MDHGAGVRQERRDRFARGGAVQGDKRFDSGPPDRRVGIRQEGSHARAAPFRFPSGDELDGIPARRGIRISKLVRGGFAQGMSGFIRAKRMQGLLRDGTNGRGRVKGEIHEPGDLARVATRPDGQDKIKAP